VLEHIEDDGQQQTLAQLLQQLGQAYWVQTAQAPGFLHRVWSGSSPDRVEDPKETKPGWIERMTHETTLGRQGLSRLFPDAAGIVAMRQIWRETSYAAYRAC
jgi:hypothetical protein